MNWTASASFAAALLAQASISPAEPRLDDYSIRADPQYASRLNPLLAAVALPAEFTVPSGMTPETYFQTLCGRGYRLGAHTTVMRDGLQVVTAAPCLQSRQNVRKTVAHGTNLEPVAKSLGLMSMNWRSFKVMPSVQALASSNRGSQVQGPKTQDVLIIPAVPEWTDFSARPGRVASRADLVAQVAIAMKCAPEVDAPKCLAERGVLVTHKEPPRAAVLPPAVTKPPAGSPEPSAASASVADFPAAREMGRLRRDVVWPLPVRSPWGPAARLFELAFQDGQPGAGAPAPAPGPAGPAPLRVAPDQWPYDAQLVVKILNQLKAKAKFLPPTVVGVADIGLADRSGGPLPADLFYVSDEDRAAAAAQGLAPAALGVGSGTDRPGTTRALAPSRDVALCPSPVDFAGWQTDAQRFASHGTIVASLAGGYALRRASPDLSSLLPQVSFYRLVGQDCAPDGATSTGDKELTNGFNYVLAKTSIVSLSYIGTSSDPDATIETIKAEIPTGTNVLFIPAGNPPAANLDDDNAPCPPCLANPGADSRVRDRIIVVGAATSDLKRASYSGYGTDAVRLYAPGEPYGAIDVLGRSAALDDPATSYATPYAAFADALLTTIGAELKWTSVAQIRARLMLSTWPLASEPGFPQARVVDLIKVAAARQNTVEVLEGVEAGHPVLRDYVGIVTAGLEGICPAKIDGATYQAVRLDPANDRGDRQVKAYLRTFNKNTNGLNFVLETCRPSGALTLVDLDGVAHQLDLRTVTQILFAWSGAPLPISARPGG